MEQTDLFGNLIVNKIAPKIKIGSTIVDNGEYIFIPNFFNKLDSDNFLQSLKENIEWKQESMNMYGKKIDFPRLTAWYGDSDKPYSFSGIKLNPAPWNEILLNIKNKIEVK